MAQQVKWTDLSTLIAKLPGEGARRLQQSLATTKAGRNVDLRTPFYKDLDRRDIVERLQREAGLTGIKVIDDLDANEAQKVGPISIMVPGAERLPGLLEYWSQTFDADEALFELAILAVERLVAPHSVAPISFQSSYGIVLQVAQSLGLPWLGRDKRKLKWYLDDALRIKSPEEAWPCVWYWRGQAKGPGQVSKQRDIWGMWHGETILGQRICFPLVERLRRVPGFSAWNSLDIVDKAVTRVLKRAQGRTIVSMDYSSFDKSIHLRMHQAADRVLKTWMSVSVSETIELLGAISVSVPIVVPDYVLSGRLGGEPSGSVLTNLKDSIINMIAAHYIALRAGVELVDIEVMGDDSIYLFSSEIPPERIAEFASEVGLVVNPDKLYIDTESVHFLQRVHTLQYVRNGSCLGVRSIIRAVTGLTGHERLRPGWNQYMESAAAIEKMETCCNHPNHPSLVRFFGSADRLVAAGLDPVTIFKRAGGAHSVREAVGAASFKYNVYDPSGVDGFATTKVIRSIFG